MTVMIIVVVATEQCHNGDGGGNMKSNSNSMWIVTLLEFVNDKCSWNLNLGFGYAWKPLNLKLYIKKEKSTLEIIKWQLWTKSYSKFLIQTLHKRMKVEQRRVKWPVLITKKLENHLSQHRVVICMKKKEKSIIEIKIADYKYAEKGILMMQ